MSQESQSAHILQLCKELLDDIELSRLPADKLLLKCSRLARLAGSGDEQKWIAFEMRGYNSTDPVSVRYMSLTARWTDYEKKKGYFGPLAQQEAAIEQSKAKIAAMRLPDVSGDWANVTISNVLNNINTTTSTIHTISGIRSRVLALLHDFVSRIYYEREFSAMAESAFETYKQSIDTLIGEHAGDVLSKIPSVVQRLAEGDSEAISQALLTCRRIIEAFADSIYPPTDATIELGGNVLKLDAGKHLNRINAYISDRTESATRRQRLRQNLSNLYDRVSTGVHNDVSVSEAFALFLNVYLFLGEILQLGEPAANAGDSIT